MLGQVGQQVAKALGDRFSLTNVLPVTMLAGVAWLLVLSQAYTDHSVDLPTVFDNLGRQPKQAVIIGFGVIVAALLLRPFQVALVQFLEGYWSSRALRVIAEVATERHRRRRNMAYTLTEFSIPDPEPGETSFEDVQIYAHRKWRVERRQQFAHEVLDRYPEAEDIMPTRIGNVLRHGEDAAGRRYGLDINAVASRLWPSLSPKVAEAISRSLDLIDTMAALCVVSALIVLATLPLLLHPNGWAWILPAAAMMVVVAYRAALRAAAGHATLLATAIDLHRFDMLAALHFRLPSTPSAEYALNKSLSKFFAAQGDLSANDQFRRYDHRSSAIKPNSTS